MHAMVLKRKRIILLVMVGMLSALSLSLFITAKAQWLVQCDGEKRDNTLAISMSSMRRLSIQDKTADSLLKEISPDLLRSRRNSTTIKDDEESVSVVRNKPSKTTNIKNLIGVENKTKESQHNGETPDQSFDILVNVSLHELKHVVESRGLNKTAFANWTYTHLAANSTDSFQLPDWYINGDNICDNDTELVILIPAVAQYQFTRDLIRQTWAGSVYGIPWPKRTVSLKTKLAFIFGTEMLTEYLKEILRLESNENYDMVAAHFVDSYRNLTLKMMVGLHWVNSFCPQAKFILKSDLDTFINLPLMTKVISAVSQKVPRFVLGHKHVNPLPLVLRNGKWGVPEEAYPFKFYPPYVIGHSYVISAELAHPMVSIAKEIPLISSEDAFITGVLTRILQVPRLHLSAFAHAYKECLPCGIIYNEEVSMTGMGMSRLLTMWRLVLLNQCYPRELLSRPVFLRSSNTTFQIRKIANQ